MSRYYVLSLRGTYSIYQCIQLTIRTAWLDLACKLSPSYNWSNMTLTIRPFAHNITSHRQIWIISQKYIFCTQSPLRVCSKLWVQRTLSLSHPIQLSLLPLTSSSCLLDFFLLYLFKAKAVWQIIIKKY